MGFRLVRRAAGGAAAEPSAAQARVIAHGEGPLLVLGGPGSGKTWTLVEAVAARLGRGDTAVVLTHDAASAVRLREALAVRAPEVAGRAHVVSWAGLALTLVRLAEPRPEILGAAAADQFLRQQVAALPDAAWPAEWAELRRTRRFARAAGEALTRLRRAGLAPAEIRAAADRAGRADWAALAGVAEAYLGGLALRRAEDFTGLVERATKLAADPAAAGWWRSWTGPVYVDHYEEADPAQVRLLAALTTPGGTVVAFGDPRQAAGVFRGAAARAVLDFPDVFGGETVVLTGQYRLAGDIWAAAGRVAGQVALPRPVPLLALGPAADGAGEVVVHTFATPGAEAEWIAATLRAAHLEGLAWAEMAVIVRSARVVGPLAAALSGAGLPLTVAWTDIPLAEEPVVADLLARLLAADGEADEPVADRLWRVWQDSAWPERLRAGLAGDAADRLAADRHLDAVCAVLDRAHEWGELAGDIGAAGFVASLDDQAIPVGPGRRLAAAQPGVAVLTAYRAKGRQFRRVVVAGVQEGVWPAPGGPGLIDLDGLVADGRADAPTYRERLLAERRLFFTAVTRASDWLAVTAVDGAAGPGGAGDLEPSRFLADLGVPVTAPAATSGLTTLTGLVGRLRLAAGDPSAHPALRDGATRQLAELTAAGLAEPGRWWGAGSGPPGRAPVEGPALSGSALESLLTCPRRWFLERRARAGRPATPASRFGTLVHELVARLAAGDLDRAGASAVLAERWDEVGYTAPWQARAQLAAAEAALDRYTVWAAGAGAPDGLEIDFDVTVTAGRHPVRLTGRFDRIDAADGEGRAWRVVDFKTGQQTPTRAAAAANLQMGVYQAALAAARPGDRVAGASLVYLRAGGDAPKVLAQPGLDGAPYLPDEPYYAGLSEAGRARLGPQADYPNWVEHALAAAALVLEEGSFPAVGSGGCRHCPVRAGCPAQAVDEEAA
jgi:superfamily I DNA/RNA helicase